MHSDLGPIVPYVAYIESPDIALSQQAKTAISLNYEALSSMQSYIHSLIHLSTANLNSPLASAKPEGMLLLDYHPSPSAATVVYNLDITHDFVMTQWNQAQQAMKEYLGLYFNRMSSRQQISADEMTNHREVGKCLQEIERSCFGFLDAISLQMGKILFNQSDYPEDILPLLNKHVEAIKSIGEGLKALQKQVSEEQATRISLVEERMAEQQEIFNVQLNQKIQEADLKNQALKQTMIDKDIAHQNLMKAKKNDLENRKKALEEKRRQQEQQLALERADLQRLRDEGDAQVAQAENQARSQQNRDAENEKCIIS